MRILLVLILILVPTNACLTEFRVVEFKPNNGVYIQTVNEDFVFNFSNPFNFTITDVNVTYRDLMFSFSSVEPKGIVNCRYNLSPKIFKLNLSYEIHGDSRGFYVKFNLRNYYENPINVKVVFPKPGWMTRCENCDVVGDSVVFNRSVVKESYFRIFGRGAGTFDIEDGRIEFEVLEKANLRFSTDVPFSITKKLSEIWSAVCEVRNDKPLTLNVTVYCYVNESKPPHNFKNSRLIKSESVTLGLNETFNMTVNSSAETPAFFIKVEPTANTTCNITVYPATKVGRNYVRYGLIGGFRFVIRSVPVHPFIPPPKYPSPPPITKTPPTTKPPVTPPTTITPPTTQPPKPTPTIGQVPLIYPVVQTNVIGSLNIAGVRIYQIKMGLNTVAVLIPITFLPAIAVIPLLFIRRSFVFDSAIFYPEEVVIGGRVVVPRGVEVGKILPADLEFAVPDMDLTRYIHEVYDVGLNQAKAIALSLEIDCPVFLSDVKSWWVAVRFGCEAYLRR